MLLGWTLPLRGSCRTKEGGLGPLWGTGAQGLGHGPNSTGVELWPNEKQPSCLCTAHRGETGKGGRCLPGPHYQIQASPFPLFLCPHSKSTNIRRCSKQAALSRPLTPSEGKGGLWGEIHTLDIQSKKKLRENLKFLRYKETQVQVAGTKGKFASHTSVLMAEQPVYTWLFLVPTASETSFWKQGLREPLPPVWFENHA